MKNRHQSLHPLLTQNYGIFTPPVAEFGQTIQRWAKDRLPGGLITGYSRTGKSTAVKLWAATLLRDTEGTTLPVITVNAINYKSSPSMFWAQFLRSGKLGNWKSGDYLNRLERVFAALYTRAMEHSSPYLVVIIDEANNLHASHWRELKSLQNDLEKEATRMTVISVGTEELAYARKTMSLVGDAHLTARFMVQQQQFRGLLDMEELRFVLDGYDLHSRWPADDGPTYVQHFLPDAFAAGFRLANHTEDVWKAITRRLPAIRGDEQLEVPMAFVSIVVESILLRGEHGVNPRDMLTQKAVTEALNLRNFGSHMETSYRFTRGGR